MLEELFEIHKQVIRHASSKIKRYLFDKINWSAKAICVTGARGVGKTTLLLQYLQENYPDVNKGLYISADHLVVIANGLYRIAQEYFKYGGEILIIDEIHKYHDWSLELKNILDVYKDKKIFVSGSSSLNLIQSKYDLSRRIVYYDLKGLSFREFLKFDQDLDMPVLKLNDILQTHVNQAMKISSATTIYKYFREYLTNGYYPYFLEGKSDYQSKVLNVIEKVLFEDIAISFNLRQPALPILKKILWLIATSHPFEPNIERLSRELGISKEYVYHYLEFLEIAGLLISLRQDQQGLRLVRKPGKIYFENTNLLATVLGTLRQESLAGTIRETFFANQLRHIQKLNLHHKGDFILEGKYICEVGGKNKANTQISELNEAYLILDNLEVGSGNRIPLYLFGFLY